VRHWTVGGAVIESDTASEASVLLVENLRHNGTSDWTPPGGVIDHGEEMTTGLRREVQEETGLEVLEWSTGPLYEIRAEAPGLGWTLEVEVHRAVRVGGRLTIGSDPDGIVVDAQWVRAGDCAGRLCDAHPWVREPLLEWLQERWEDTRRFRYRIDGDHFAQLAIVRI
jgi:8-oxo-dGTP diphosphatase